MSTIIGNVNEQRNANCMVQASQLNGGNLAQHFNLQAMRIVKGFGRLSSSSFGSVGGNGQVLISQYDGSPVELGSSELIIAATIENASGSPTTSVSPSGAGTVSVGYTPLVGSGNVTLAFAGVPTYNSSTSSWNAGTAGAVFTNGFTTANLNGGVRFLPIAANTSQNYWINCITNSSVYTSANPSVIVTFLIMSPRLAI
jgi:hypothetical protein